MHQKTEHEASPYHRNVMAEIMAMFNASHSYLVNTTGTRRGDGVLSC